MYKPLVTILLPVYNGEKTIRSTLHSLLNQTYKNFELLIGIDGTTDGSKAIALAFNDSRIEIIEHSENLGLANNLNEIIKRASNHSKFFAMAEQDDIYVPERLAWQVKIMEMHKDIGLVSGIAEFKNEHRSILFPGILVHGGQYPAGEEMFRYLYINQMKVLNTCMLWRKTIHVKHNLRFRNTYGNFNVDWNFMLRFSLISNIHGIHKKLVIMNRRSDRTSVTVDKKKQYAASKKLINDFFQEFPNIIDKDTYKKSINIHHRITLGANTKLNIVFKSILFYLNTGDKYYLGYLKQKIKKYLS